MKHVSFSQVLDEARILLTTAALFASWLWMKSLNREDLVLEAFNSQIVLMKTCFLYAVTIGVQW